MFAKGNHIKHLSSLTKTQRYLRDSAPLTIGKIEEQLHFKVTGKLLTNSCKVNGTRLESM